MDLQRVSVDQAFSCCLCSSDAETRGNPLVSGFLDELDPDDTATGLGQLKAPPPSKNITLTSDEEEAPATRLDEGLDSEPDLKV